MKTLELEVGEIQTADEVVKFLKDNEIGEGDTLKILTDEEKSSIILVSILFIVALAIAFYFNNEKKKRENGGEKMLDDLFKGKTTDEMEKEIEAEYGVKIEIEHIADDGRNGWMKISKQGLSHAYGDNEPDYSDADIKVPSPKYKGWKKAK
jgi:preprotein translocase subunit YajC